MAGNQRDIERLLQLPQLLQILADDNDLLAEYSSRSRAMTSALAGFFAGDAVLLPPLGHGVFQPQLVGHGDAHLGAVRFRDPALRLQFLPGHVVLFRADQAEDIPSRPSSRMSVAVIPSRRRAWNLGRHPKHRRRQQVNFVVDDQAPVALVKQLEMRILILLVGRCVSI